MDKTIKTCFCLYVNHMKNIVKNLNEYDYSVLTLNEIRDELNIIYIKYILSSPYSISDNSIGIVAYKHIKKMLDEESSKTKYIKIVNEFKMLGIENCYLKDEISNLKKTITSLKPETTLDTILFHQPQPQPLPKIKTENNLNLTVSPNLASSTTSKKWFFG